MSSALDGAIGEQRAQRKAQVGGVQDFAAGRSNGLGQALAAKVCRVLQPCQPASVNWAYASLKPAWW